jgi:3-hydroxybutyryl-CoA dehydrogenase
MTDVRFSVDRIATVAVLGSGTMGHGIAQIAAHAGCAAVVHDVDPAAAARAIDRIRGNLDKGVALGKVASADRDATIARVRAARDLADACATADLVIEAVPERLELKRELFAAVDAAAPAHALLATNTSSLPVARIAAAVADPSRMVGMHFFNPVHVMKLCEVVRHPGTDPAAIATAFAIAARWGKTPITVNDSPGFASSRLGLVLGLEAIRMVEQGVASVADIDTAMKLGYGHPMGPLELTDLVGLDVRLGIADYLAGPLGPTFAAPALLRDHVAAGRLGKKTGEGFYRWVDGKKVASQ